MAANFQWMLGSIEWDFATKVTVAVITALGTIVAALIGARKLRAPAPEVAEAQRHRSTTSSAPLAVPVIAAPATVRRKEPVPFTHSEISAHIKRGTPYQQSLLEKDYIGSTIRWQGILRSIDRYAEGKVTVVVDCADDKTHVSCNATENDIVDLRLAETGSMVEVVGVIECVSGAYTELSECLIRRVGVVAPSNARD